MVILNWSKRKPPAGLNTEELSPGQAEEHGVDDFPAGFLEVGPEVSFAAEPHLAGQPLAGDIIHGGADGDLLQFQLVKGKAEHHFHRFGHQPFTGVVFMDEVIEFGFGHPPVDAEEADHANEGSAFIFPNPKGIFLLEEPACQHFTHKELGAFFIPDNFHRLREMILQAAVVVLDEVVKRFAFLLAIPAVVLSGFYQLYKLLSGKETFDEPMLNIAVATIVAFVVGYAVIAWLLRYLTTHSMAIFVWYRVIVGAGVLTLTAAGLISV